MIHSWLPISLAALLWFVSGTAYDLLVPGIPDSGMLPIVAVPLAFPVYGSARLWTSFDMLVVWVLSCLTFLLPQFVAFALVTTKRDIVWFGVLTLAEWLLGVWRLQALSYGDYGFGVGIAAMTIAALLGIGGVLGCLFKRSRAAG
ncbi:MAG: hypothetical protein RL088_3224 [Verrucomicrobiota bacterium]